MDSMETARGRAIVVQPEEGRSWWQPMPANGHADPKLVPSDTGFGTLSMGLPDDSTRRARAAPFARHAGRASDLLPGTGKSRRGRREPPESFRGTACFLGPDVKHEIVNEDDGDLVMLWVISPAGLEDFFASVGRERTRGEPVPSPFERPADVVAIERNLGMNDTAASG